MAMMTLKELSRREDQFVSGHGMCPGCAVPSILKLVLRAARAPIAAANATGCLQMASTPFPHTSWKLNWIHTALGNAPAVTSGLEAMYRSLKKQGRLPADRETKFLAIGGDGATGDIGFSALSGAIDRGHSFVYLNYNNQLCASTGGQWDSTTPMGAGTTTTPVGDALPGNLQPAKDTSRLIAAHKIPYMAQSAPWIWQDLYQKAERAFDTAGPAYLGVLSPCPAEWKTPTQKTMELTRLAADTCVWPIYEVKNGTKITINYKPKEKLPVTRWLNSQPRFKHLLNKENKWIVEKIQEEVDKDWEYLLSSETNQRDK